MATKKSVLFAGLFGNALEWYDFILFANFAPILATIFFPATNPLTSLLLTFAVFATGFLVRPIGALIFGHIGDHRGRRAALIVSISVITLPTLLIGFLPSYASIGLAAPLILTLLRIAQGIAISGELNSAATFLVEHAKPNRRGYTGSLVMGTALFGILMGAFIAFIVNTTLSTAQIMSWGWRAPFWFSGLLGMVGIFLRVRTHESPKFVAEVKSQTLHTPIKQVFLFYRKELLLTIGLTSLMAVGNYVFIAYLVTYLVKSQGFSMRDASIINLIATFLCVISLPIMGLLSDQIGRKPIFKAGLWGFILFSLPIFWLLSQSSFVYALAGDLLYAVILAPVAALIPTLLAELFPTHVRNSGTTLGYNISLAIFGGTAPLVSLWLVQVSGSHFAPGIYLIICAIFSAIALSFMEESHEKVLA